MTFHTPKDLWGMEKGEMELPLGSVFHSLGLID